MTLHFRYFILSVLVCIIWACSKPGLGGNATVAVQLQHHGQTVKNNRGWPDTVFVKFNAKDFPGSRAAAFDAYFVSEAGSDLVYCKNLKWGNYYLYGVGADSCSGSLRVSGGLSIKIKYGQRKQETDVIIPVSE